MGAKAYTIAAELMPSLTGAIIEIGSEREEGSTAFLAKVAFHHGEPFHTVDMDSTQYEVARNIVGDAAHHMLGEAFLLTYNQPIAFLYLDNFDWQWEGVDPSVFQSQIDRYEALGLAMTNLNSQAAHLAQAIASMPWLSPRCGVLIDDTYQRSDGTFGGKGGACVPYLSGAGFMLDRRFLHAQPEHSAVLLLRK
jgi:hypothetical protein